MERLLHHGAQLLVLTRQLVVGDALPEREEQQHDTGENAETLQAALQLLLSSPVSKGISTEVQSDRRLIDDLAQREPERRRIHALPPV
jgi:hypothetical protein